MNAISSVAMGLFAVLLGVQSSSAQVAVPDFPYAAATRPATQPKVSRYVTKRFKVTSSFIKNSTTHLEFAGGLADGIEIGQTAVLHRGFDFLANVKVNGVDKAKSSGWIDIKKSGAPISVRVGDELFIRMLTPAGAMLDQADKLQRKGEAAKAQALYEKVIAGYGGSGMAAEAMWSMAQMSRAKKDTAAEIEWLRKCAGTEKVKGDDMLGEAGSYARPSAIERLAQIYFLRKDWKKALEYAKAMEVFGWCGTGAAAFEADKSYYIAVCQLRLGQVDEAMKVIEPHVFDARSLDMNGLDEYRYMVLMCDFADETGKLDEFEGRLKKNPWKGVSRSHGAQVGLEYIELLRMMRSKDPRLLERLKKLTRDEGGAHAYQVYFGLLARIGSKEAMDFISSMATSNVYGERRYAAQAVLEELNVAAPQRKTN